MTHLFNWKAGYSSQRSPVFGRNVVFTSHTLVAQAGWRVLIKGGHAVMVAVAALMIVQSVSNGQAEAF